MNIPASKEEVRHKRRKTYFEKVKKLLPYIKLFPKVIKLIQPVFYTFLIAYAFKFVLAALHVKKVQYLGGIADVFSLKRVPWDLKPLVINLALYYIAFNVINFVIARLNARIVGKLNREVRADLYKNVLEKDMEFFDKKSPYDAINAVNEGIEGVQNLATKRIHGTFNPFLKIFATLGLLYGISSELTMMVLLIAPFRIYMQNHKKQEKEKVSKEENREIAQTFDIPTYTKDRIFLIKAYSTEEKEVDAFVEKANQINIQPSKKGKSFWRVKLAKGSLGWVFQLTLLTYGGFLIMRRKLSFGDLFTFNMYFAMFINSISSSMVNFKSLLKSLKQSDHLFKILEYQPKIKANDKRCKQKPVINGNIAFNNISFKYPTKPQEGVLDNVTLNIEAGESVGFAGSSGSGKSSMIKLLQRLYEPVNGQIFIDGNNIKTIDLHWLHHNIGFVPEKPILIDGTIEENIAYGNKSYTHEQLNKAFALVDAEFLSNKILCPQGLQTKVGVKGTKLSAGQIQKIAIARALINEPKILIMDEVSAGLDDQERGEIDNIINKLICMKNKTVVVCSENTNVLRNCNKVYAFGEGKVIEQRPSMTAF